MARGAKPGERRGGRTKGTPNKSSDLKMLCRAHTEAAVNALVVALDDPSKSVPAAVALLDRGWGKPAQPQTGADGEGPVLTRVEYVWLPSES